MNQRSSKIMMLRKATKDYKATQKDIKCMYVDMGRQCTIVQ